MEVRDGVNERFLDVRRKMLNVLWLVIRKQKRNNFNGTNNINRSKDQQEKEEMTFLYNSLSMECVVAWVKENEYDEEAYV